MNFPLHDVSSRAGRSFAIGELRRSSDDIPRMKAGESTQTNRAQTVPSLEPERIRIGRGMSPATALSGALVLLALVHLVQVFSPMRLNLDAIGYLSRTIEIVEGERFGPTWLPPGYSYALAALEWVGAGNARAFALLNYLLVGVGIYATFHVLRGELELRRVEALGICCLMLLSFVLVKYLPIPLGDTVYFGLSMAAIALFARLRQGVARPVVVLAAAAGIVVLAIFTRTVGITLPAGLIGLAWYQYRHAPAREAASPFERRVELVTIVFGFLLAASAAVFLLTSRYASEVGRIFGVLGFRTMATQIAESRFRNWGELLLNVPQNRLPDLLEWVVYPAGMLAILLVFYGIVRRRSRWGPAEAYFGAYFLVLMVYPGAQTRYWLPMLPLMMGWIAVAIRPFLARRSIRMLATTYLVCFVLIGTLALGYSSRITLSGREVGQVYGEGTLSRAYDAAFNELELTSEDFGAPMNYRAYLLLRRYDPRLNRATAPDRHFEAP